MLVAILDSNCVVKLQVEDNSISTN